MSNHNLNHVCIILKLKLPIYSSVSFVFKFLEDFKSSKLELSLIYSWIDIGIAASISEYM